MNEPRTCYACNGEATQIRERADLGEKADRVFTCAAKECQPEHASPGERWLRLPINGEDLVALAPQPKQVNGNAAPSGAVYRLDDDALGE